VEKITKKKIKRQEVQIEKVTGRGVLKFYSIFVNNRWKIKDVSKLAHWGSISWLKGNGRNSGDLSNGRAKKRMLI